MSYGKALYFNGLFLPLEAGAFFAPKKKVRKSYEDCGKQYRNVLREELFKIRDECSGSG